ncbi:MAG TPA: hypothetical protein PLJ42_04620 [Chitinophagales bacterium]|jgi:cell division protein FtsQ|nr:hypothetical protein [Chitinophagales bacterium]MBP6154409.1 hypothetical protein [Chitinophagales bacterium]HQV77975.1 hypothetical protein [Chitinophagales bacterium]HQW78697.1 hypothetical protein [Chitinophagales bacterium]HRB18505.1 hypothetical protein [Chitinophagales bacterium]
MNKTIKNILLRFSILLGILVFIALIVMAFQNRNENRVQKINIEIDDWKGNFFVNKEQVLTVLNNRYDVYQKKLSGRDLGKIEKAISIIPQVRTANAFTDNKGNLNIKIEQRIPVLRVYNLQGSSYYVDQNKIKFLPSNHFTANVPIVSGKIIERIDTTRQKIKDQKLHQVFNIIQTVQKNKLWSALIGQYYINDKMQIELIPRFGNASILIGDDKNVDIKLKQLEVFYFDVLKKVGWNYYKVINIMYKNQVVCLK